MNDKKNIWKRHAVRQQAERRTEAPDLSETEFAELEDVDEKLDWLANVVLDLAEHVDRVTEQLEELAEAQGKSQQADHGKRAGSSEEKVWGENSPFAPTTGGDAW
jgi:hypothetical protein